MSPRPDATPRWLARSLDGIHRVEDAVLALLLGAMILLASAQILLRNVFDSGLSWSDPLLRVMVLWVGLLGALAASRGDRHITVDVLSRVLRGRARLAAQVATSFFTSGVAGLIAWHAARFVATDRQAGVTGAAGLPVWIFELVLPFAFAMIAIRYLILCFVRVSALGRGESGEPAGPEGSEA